MRRKANQVEELNFRDGCAVALLGCIHRLTNETDDVVTYEALMDELKKHEAKKSFASLQTAVQRLRNRKLCSVFYENGTAYISTTVRGAHLLARWQKLIAS